MHFVALMAAKNEGNFLPLSLNSIFTQTKTPDILYFLDDFSTDKTKDIAKSFDRLKYLHAEDFGFAEEKKQHGKRIKSLQNKLLELLLHEDWEYLLVIDADIVLPKEFCQQMICYMDKTCCVMAGAKYVETPTKIEVSTDIHVRGCAFIVARPFIDSCLNRGFPLGTEHGEVLWERFGLANDYKITALPIKVYEMRETGVTSEELLNYGRNLYRLGTPFLTFLSLRRVSLKCLIGYFYALLHAEPCFLSKLEKRNLLRVYFKQKLRRVGVYEQLGYLRLEK